MPGDLARLLDEVFLNLVPAAPRILQLLRERGWSGWTNMKPTASGRTTGSPAGTPAAIRA